MLRIQRAIRYWIYQRKYLPYLRLKRRRDKIKLIQHYSYRHLKQAYQPLCNKECYVVGKTVGFMLNLQHMPLYFKEVTTEASKQLNDNDI